MLRPLNDYVLIEPIVQAKTQSGFILAHQDENFADKGTVIAIGPKCEDVKIGQTIQFSSHFSERLEIDGKKMLIVQPKNIYGVEE